MPSSATITSFYNFAANTKARASQMNNNFDVFRGHIIPVHVSTATSANNTYDLGSYEYRWKTMYLNNLELGSTSTSSSILSLDSGTTSSEYVFKIAGVEKLRINTNGIWTPYTLGLTTSAGVGQYAISNTIPSGSGGVGVSNFTTISSSRVSIATTGRPVLVKVVWDGDNGSLSLSNATATGAIAGVALNNGTTLVSRAVRFAGSGAGSAARFTDISWIDFPIAGTQTYDVGLYSADTSTSATWNKYRIFAKEIY